MQIEGTGATASFFWRLATRIKACGVKTDAARGCLFERIGGTRNSSVDYPPFS